MVEKTTLLIYRFHCCFANNSQVSEQREPTCLHDWPRFPSKLAYPSPFVTRLNES